MMTEVTARGWDGDRDGGGWCCDRVHTLRLGVSVGENCAWGEELLALM